MPAILSPKFSESGAAQRGAAHFAVIGAQRRGCELDNCVQFDLRQTRRYGLRRSAYLPRRDHRFDERDTVGQGDADTGVGFRAAVHERAREACEPGSEGGCGLHVRLHDCGWPVSSTGKSMYAPFILAAVISKGTGADLSASRIAVCTLSHIKFPENGAPWRIDWHQTASAHFNNHVR